MKIIKVIYYFENTTWIDNLDIGSLYMSEFVRLLSGEEVYLYGGISVQLENCFDLY